MNSDRARVLRFLDAVERTVTSPLSNMLPPRALGYRAGHVELFGEGDTGFLEWVTSFWRKFETRTTTSCISSSESVGVRAILARFVVVNQVRKPAPTRPQTVPGSRGVEVGEARDRVERSPQNELAARPPPYSP